MSTVLETVRHSESYRSRSEELLCRAADGQPRGLPALHLYELLDCVAAAVVLEKDLLAHQYLHRFISQGFLLEKDGSFEAEFKEAQAGYHEFAEPYLHVLANARRMELALGCRKRLAERPALPECAQAVLETDGYLNHENYLIELARGRRLQAEAHRADCWAQWLEEGILDEEDRGWKIAIAIGQGREQDFQHLVAQYIKQDEERATLHGPYGHHFAPTILGLEVMAILRTAQECQLTFPSVLSCDFGLGVLLQQRMAACT